MSLRRARLTKPGDAWEGASSRVTQGSAALGCKATCVAVCERDDGMACSFVFSAGGPPRMLPALMLRCSKDRGLIAWRNGAQRAPAMHKVRGTGRHRGYFQGKVCCQCMNMSNSSKF